MNETTEYQRLVDHRHRVADWRKWGPYVSDRAWGTVREDYSPDGSVWNYFPHDHARSRAYRWGEDGIGGLSDRHQYMCFATALWNGKDPILKERMFGLTGPEGNHGEDVKEYWFHLDNTPTHSYMKMLYKYPQQEFPYAGLVAENARRGFSDFEYELLDTGVFENNRYFDVFIEYAKVDPDDIMIKITVINRGPQTAVCWVLPMLWFRNTWSWGYAKGPMGDVSGKPQLKQIQSPEGLMVVKADHPAAGTYYLYAAEPQDLLFTDNETNTRLLYNQENAGPYVKDAFHRFLVNGEVEAVNPAKQGTKVAVVYRVALQPAVPKILRLRLSQQPLTKPFEAFYDLFVRRITEADEFYDALQPERLSEDERALQRQALAGMLWTKQFFYYNAEQWLKGDPAMPPPENRAQGRNHKWEHLNNFDIISMPDKWEYPWYAAWDLAFHCIPFALADGDFAKRQLALMAREWYMHPNGQLPACEWQFGDVNPPVHAWACWRVYKVDAKQTGTADRRFLESIFHKLLLNFTWWVNKKDEEGKNVFQGGFLGLDNISVFDRSAPLPTGGHIDQSDGTAWMGFYCLVMLKIALELAGENPVYQDTASKFFEHFLRIARAMTGEDRGGLSLWHEQDGFFYDAIHLPDGRAVPLKVRSLVGLMPLLAVETLEHDLVESMPDFRRRLNWFFANRSYLRDRGDVACVQSPGAHSRRLLSIVNRERLIRILGPMLDEAEFLSEYGIRSLSKYHQDHPYTFYVNGQAHTISYQPAESQTGLFGGNSNWRGPIWFPINYLLIESLQKFHHYYGDSLKVECPTGSGHLKNLQEVALDLSRRLIGLFLCNGKRERPIYGGQRILQDDPHWRNLILFNEYFHGDNGAGLGASHQTGWTGLVAKLIQQAGGWQDRRTLRAVDSEPKCSEGRFGLCL
jgi:Mannosylglycerate hydrolase MGH1-like glycoside hydrolase domain/Glycosyl hydrolase family 63 C-terminal domain